MDSSVQVSLPTGAHKQGHDYIAQLPGLRQTSHKIVSTKIAPSGHYYLIITYKKLNS